MEQKFSITETLKKIKKLNPNEKTEIALKLEELLEKIKNDNK